MNPHLKIIQDEITALICAHPELEDDEVLRENMLEGSTQLPEFVSDLLQKIGSTQALIDGTGAYIKRLQDRKARLEHREYMLRLLIMRLFNHANIRKMELAEGTAYIRNNPAKVVIVEEAAIPDEFMRIKKEPDKTKIKAALQAHEIVPGASLSNGEPSLAIA